MINESIFKLDERFVEELRDRLVRLQETMAPGSTTESGSAGYIPTVQQLEEIILAVFWASMQREEGRLSRFRVAFSKPVRSPELALTFEVPKPWSVDELRKLSPAVTPPGGQIVVWPSKEDGQLHIRGLQTKNLAINPMFEVIDPGRLTVNDYGFTLAEVTGQRAGFISTMWRSQCFKLMTRFAHVTRVSESPTSAALLSIPAHITRQILHRIRLLGHGGAIIFVRQDGHWNQFIDQPVFYAAKQQQQLNQMQPIIDTLTKELQGIESDDALGKPVKLLKGLGLLDNDQYGGSIGDAARSIAYLTAVDGATILSDSYQVLAFGAKIRVPPAKTTPEAPTMVTQLLPLETDLPEDVRLDQAFRGTRHLSAAQFVLANSGSIAFVVSQDGGITGLATASRSEDDPAPKLLAYRGLELLL